MTKPRYETTLGRAALALLAVAICGAAYLTILVLTDQIDFFALVAVVPLGVGSLLLAVRVWWLLHLLGLRTPIQAAIWGAALSLVTYLAWRELIWRFLAAHFMGPAPISDSLGAGYWPAMIESAVWFSIAGAIAGLVLWRIAYREARNEN
jgi:hypothetical protein